MQNERDELQSMLVKHIVEGFDLDTLLGIALDNMNSHFSEYSLEQLKTEIEEQYPELHED